MNEWKETTPFSQAPLLVIFDGQCGLCTRLVRWVRARDAVGRIVALPNQTSHLIERCSLTRSEVDREVWVIEATDRKFTGAAAIHRVLEELGGPWAWWGALYRLAPYRWVADRAYRWVAEHRYQFGRWGLTPACDVPALETTTYPPPKAR